MSSALGKLNGSRELQGDDAQEASRGELLDALRAQKMARSPHAFVRGNTIDHYRWLSRIKANLPDGPPVWICGDCHVGNLGPVADLEGGVEIQIRDLDQTVIGNPAHDLVRLALSLASAARGSNLAGITTARMIEVMIEGYEAGLEALDDEKLAVREPEVVKTVRRQALGRKWRDLANERIGGTAPFIPLGKRFWAPSDDEKWEIGLLLDSPQIKSLILALNRRSDEARVELVDAAYWVKGCSSLGKLRYAALVHVSGERKDRFSLIDIKQAVPSAAPAKRSASMPRHHGERVVAGARALSPNLGDRMAAGDLCGQPVIVRELMPNDLKLELEQFSREDAVRSARYLAGVVGKAHGRQMAPDIRQAWNRELHRRHPPDIAAPTWLWNTVVGLLVRHEEAYLKHCRRTAFAVKPGAAA
jgi:uncharacterized protein (DUF2252 family)